VFQCVKLGELSNLLDVSEMKRYLNVRLTVLLALVLVCGCSCAMASATYTNGFSGADNCNGCFISPFGSGPPPLPLAQYSGSFTLDGPSFATYDWPDYVQTFMHIDFSALVSNLTETVNCGAAQGSCIYNWFGTFNGGNAPIKATIVSTPVDMFPNQTFTHLTFNGAITGGTFNGVFDTYCHPCDPGSVDLHLTIDGTWSNGWKSEGNLDVRTDLDGPYPELILATTVPEPGSLVILGSGITVLAGALRRKLFR